MFSVAQNRDPVGLLKRLFQGMRDENERNPIGLEFTHEIEQVLGFLRRQRCRRLVEDNNAGLVVHGAGDLDHLALGRTERTGKRIRVHVEVERAQQLPGLVFQSPDRVDGLLATQHKVLRNGQLRNQAGFLKHHRDAAVIGVQRLGDCRLFAVDQVFAFIGLDDSSDNLAECRLACTIFADKRVHLAGSQIEVHLIKRSHSAVALRCSPKCKHRLSHLVFPSGR